MSNPFDKHPKKEEPKKVIDTAGESAEDKAKRSADEITKRILDNQPKAK